MVSENVFAEFVRQVKLLELPIEEAREEALALAKLLEEFQLKSDD